jgi:hypothetical protein
MATRLRHVSRLVPAYVVVVALCLGSVAVARADGGDVLWTSEGDSAGPGTISHVTKGSNIVLAVGYVWSPPVYQPLVRAYAPTTGVLLWSHHDGSAPLGDAAHAVLSGERAYVTGSLQRSERGHDLFVRAYDVRTGAIVWQDRHDPSTSTPGTWARGHAIASTDGRVFAAANYADLVGSGGGGLLVRPGSSSSSRSPTTMPVPISRPSP